MGCVAWHPSTVQHARRHLVPHALEAMPARASFPLHGESTATHVQRQVQATGSGIPAGDAYPDLRAVRRDQAWRHQMRLVSGAGEGAGAWGRGEGRACRGAGHLLSPHPAAVTRGALCLGVCRRVKGCPWIRGGLRGTRLWRRSALEWCADTPCLRHCSLPTFRGATYGILGPDRDCTGKLHGPGPRPRIGKREER